MNITQLEYILAVDRKRNFNKAAKSCFVTQPTLSAMIQKMEDEIGVEIFDRGKKPVEPTKIGETILLQAQKTVEEFKKIQEIASDYQQKIDGVFRVGIIPTIATYLVPHFLKSFHQSYPDVSLKIREMTTEECLHNLDNDYIDVAILATYEDERHYHSSFLYREELKLYHHEEMSENKPFETNEIDPTKIWLLEEGHCLRDEVLDICKIRKDFEQTPQNLRIQVGNLELLKQLVRNYYGYTILPSLAILELGQDERKRLRRMVNPTPTRPIVLTAKINNAKTKLIEVFGKEIRANLPKIEGISLSNN